MHASCRTLTFDSVEEKINPAAATYHYEQLAKIIESKIRTGSLAAGSRLPGELILSQEYGVGSNTVRRALDILRERGLIITVRARGSFVIEELPHDETDRGGK
ncbi:winged helix-turn-helix transcriptional regulator [Streptomyces sp. SID12501]|uniref:Winged helix-turn-helix transcriptional regulator n=1 Tax=Streptomyces sp. SID12501 TaxID=2706042 RepID=A0A6B3BX66_9ACTN|nr:winged helix-turn-helix domain-containing protein [Streptomyces sp. SID12501]NEC88948.1 winged helix-turn-helix transcriptional regulator [Streptomyces sp. SID12501]